ncbi:MAG: OmpH family outer membrane protein [Bacteroidota bacterium]
MTRRKTMMILFGAALLAVAAFASQIFGAAAARTDTLTPQSVGLVDPSIIQEKFPDYVRLMELKKAYDNELNVYSAYLQSQVQSYILELNKKEEAESEGKSPEEKKTIQAKYANLAQVRKQEATQQNQAKIKELQDKLNAERDKAEAKVTAAIEAVSAEKGVAIVLNKTAVYFGGLDITADVLAKGEVKK